MVDNITEEKKRLRKIFKQQRQALSTEEVEKRSQQICQNFITNLLPKIYQKNSPKIFSLYLASNNEVATTEISNFFTNEKISFSYPKIIAPNQALEFYLAEKNQNFAPNNIYPTILEPQNGTKILPDYIILPLVAFDFNGLRLGMGGGFFDRTIQYLKQHKSQIVTIGLAYDFQGSITDLPHENNDQILDFIVTEKSLISKKLTLR